MPAGSLLTVEVWIGSGYVRRIAGEDQLAVSEWSLRAAFPGVNSPLSSNQSSNSQLQKMYLASI